MSSIRITQRLMVERSLTAMQTGAGRLARSQEQLSTGRQINRPSDSPTGTNSAMRLREELSAAAQHARNASDGLAWLGRTDNTLTTMVDQTRRSRDLMLQGANGATGQQAKDAIAAELTQIRESLLSLANTQHLGRPIFGGTTDGGAAYGTTTGAYVGQPAPSEIKRTVGNGVEVTINTVGPDAFSAAGTDLFEVLDDAITTLKAGGNPAAHLDDLDAVMKTMLSELADVGTRYGRVESALASVNSSTLDMQAALSEVENVDIAKAIVDLQMQEVAYQAALGATARVIQPSLLDFLR
ncbi:MAG TPA: flagellar hook-associated protein FlgL [Nocardioidaceae bacterium]